MNTLSNNFMLRPFCLVIAAAFCVIGCSSPEQETTTPQQNKAEVVDMKIKPKDTGLDKKTDEPSDSTSPGSGTSNETNESSSGLSLTPPKS